MYVVCVYGGASGVSVIFERSGRHFKEKLHLRKVTG